MVREVFWIALVGGCAVPPSRVEVGGGPDRRLTVAASSASASNRADVPLDVAGGYVARERTDRVQHGSFVEVSVPAWRSGSRYVWIGGRVESYWTRAEDGDTRASGLVRVSSEVVGRVHATGSDRDAAAIAHGRFGLGAFVEAGPELLTDGQVVPVARVGLAIRVPFLAVATSLKGSFFVW